MLYTAAHCQLVLMSLRPLEEIGSEVHEDGDQLFRFEKGEGESNYQRDRIHRGRRRYRYRSAGATHNVINTSQTDALKLYTIYAPPHHRDSIIRITKEEAETDGPEFDGTTTE